jgi:DNA-binding MarR family transcriptional regulator
MDLAVGVSLAGKAVDAAVIAGLREARLAGLRVGHGYVVQRLIAGPGTIGEIAVALGVSQQSVSRSVGELAAAGYVRARADPGDRRRRLQELTPAGRRAVEVSRQVRRDLQARLEARIGADDVAVAARVMVELLDLLGLGDDVRHRTVAPDDEAPS